MLRRTATDRSPEVRCNQRISRDCGVTVAFDCDLQIGHGFLQGEHHLFAAVYAGGPSAGAAVVVEVSRHISADRGGVALVNKISEVGFPPSALFDPASEWLA